jgi:hypothetical protein
LRVPPDQFAEQWRRMQALLDEITGDPAGSTAPKPTPRRRDFWKRT